MRIQPAQLHAGAGGLGVQRVSCSLWLPHDRGARNILRGRPKKVEEAVKSTACRDMHGHYPVAAGASGRAACRRAITLSIRGYGAANVAATGGERSNGKACHAVALKIILCGCSNVGIVSPLNDDARSGGVSSAGTSG